MLALGVSCQQLSRMCKPLCEKSMRAHSCDSNQFHIINNTDYVYAIFINVNNDNCLIFH